MEGAELRAANIQCICLITLTLKEREKNGLCGLKGQARANHEREFETSLHIEREGGNGMEDLGGRAGADDL